MDRPLIAAPVAERLRPLIDAAIHLVLEDAARQSRLLDGLTFRCADYAILGARVLSKLTKHPYAAVAGKAIIDCGAGRFLLFAPSRTVRRRATSLSQVSGYHCWIESLHPLPGGQSRLEIIDFTIRHDPATAMASGVPFAHDVSSYLWGWSDAIKPPPLEVRLPMGGGQRASGWLWKDTPSSQLVRKYEKDYDATFERLAWLAILRLCDTLEDKSAAAAITAAPVLPAD